MEPFRSTLVRLVNDARVNPAAAGEKMYSELEKHFEEEEFHYFEKHIETFEGIIALEDYRNWMSKRRSCKPLIVSQALNSVAQSIADQKGLSGKCDHEEPQVIYDRISALAEVQGRIGELISVKAHSSEEIAAFLLIDDGMATRKRRRMLLDEKYSFIGVGTAYHRTHDIITVVLLAESVVEARHMSSRVVVSEEKLEGSVKEEN